MRVDGVFQVAYTVADIEASALAWTQRLSIGPWFVRGPFTPQRATYRGAPTDLSMSVARTFSGETMIELVAQHDDRPSVFRELVQRRGHGFHHWAIATRDLEATLAGYAQQGYEIAFADELPTGASIRYVDTSADLPGMIEVVGLTDAQEAAFAAMRDAAAGWDGADPIRRD
jgi:hypothetical protein